MLYADSNWKLYIMSRKFNWDSHALDDIFRHFNVLLVLISTYLSFQQDIQLRVFFANTKIEWNYLQEI